MQKNINASILLWSIFLSLIISVLFISISTKIGKIIRENDKKKEDIFLENQKDNLLKKSSVSSNSGVIDLSSIYKKQKLSIDNKRNFNINLKKDQIIDIKSTQQTNITIDFNKDVIIEFSTGTNLSQFLNSRKTIKVSTGETLHIKNLGSIAELNIFSEKEVDFPYRKYKLEQNIGGIDLEKESGVIFSN